MGLGCGLRGCGIGPRGSGGAAAPAPTVAITSPVAGAIAERLDTTLVVSGTFSDATSIEVFSGATSWGAATLGAGTWTLTRTLQLTDVTETAVLKATATGTGTTDSATVTIKIRKSMADFGTLIGWSRADRGITLNGADVAQWNDLSGNARHYTADAGKQPAYSATAWNAAQPGLTFDGAAEFMRANGYATALSGTDVAFTVFFVGQPTAAGASKYVWSAANNNAAGNGRHALFSGAATFDARIQRKDDAGATATATTTETLGTNRHLVSHVFTGSTVSAWFDQTLTTVNAAALDVAACTLGRWGIGALLYGVAETAAAYAPIVLTEVVVFAGALSDANRAAAEDLLQLRWSGLP